MLYCLPFLPLSGRAAREVVDHATSVFAEYGFTPYITLNLVDTRVIDCVINLAFDRNEADRTRTAHSCIERLQAELIKRGYIPYRVGVQTMSQVVRADDPYWQTVRSLKQVLDPHNIIAPGRYCPP
jgi:4-cresol dehydrogenase (hydroxylating)